MAVFASQYAPNPKRAVCDPDAATWVIVASDGTAYATYAALIAAGKTPYPGLDAGGFLESCLIKSKTSAGADGSPFLFRTNGTAAPASDDEAVSVSGSGQAWPVHCPFELIWIRLTVSTDEVTLDGAF